MSINYKMILDSSGYYSTNERKNICSTVFAPVANGWWISRIGDTVQESMKLVCEDLRCRLWEEIIKNERQ